jgi:hypothetical protein
MGILFSAAVRRATVLRKGLLGALSGALNGNSARIVDERAEMLPG